MYTGTDAQSGAAALSADDYAAYLGFVKQCSPECKNTGWLREYFDEMAACGLCVGVFGRGKLVSCTDAPEMPYFPELAPPRRPTPRRDYAVQARATRRSPLRYKIDFPRIPNTPTRTVNRRGDL